MAGGWTEADVLRINALRSVKAKIGAPVTPEPEPPKRSKYRNVRVEALGETFDSKREAEYWLALKAREAAGEITQLERQTAFPLYGKLHNQPGMFVQVAEYRADFTFFEHGTLRVLDAKHEQTKTHVYRLKKKWLELQDGIFIEEV